MMKVGGKGSFMLCGGVEVEAKGQNLERFLNISAKRTLRIESVNAVEQPEQEEAHIRFFTSPKDFKNMKDVAHKTGVRLRIIGRHGLPFFLHRNRRRKLLVSGIGFFFLFLYIVSFFIWDISFEGNHRFTDNMLNGYLKTVPIYYGMRKSEISCEELEAGIRNYFTEITWVSAEIQGTRLTIRVKENEALLEPVKMDVSPCDLIAEKAGQITEVVIRNGFSQVKIGDNVESGALLVDGTVPIYDDAETLVASHEIHADAEVYAKTVHTIKRDIDDSRTIKARTGHVRHGLYFRVFGYPFYLLFPAYGNGQWELLMEQKQVKILENFYLPVHIGKITAYEYEEYERFYTKAEIEMICEEYIQEYMEKLSEKGIQILGSDGKIEHSESGWQIEGTITVIEDIAVEIPVAAETEAESDAETESEAEAEPETETGSEAETKSGKSEEN